MTDQKSNFELIETFQWNNVQGFIRLDYHLDRLRKSAEKLGFTYQEEVIVEKLRQLKHTSPLQRVRIELQSDGQVKAETFPHTSLSLETCYKLKLAKIKLNTADPLLCHKTTRREIYVSARTEFSADVADEVILANERDEICEGTITNIFIRPTQGAHLLTPDLKCGLLRGVLRQTMLDQGHAKEAILTEQDLYDADEIFVGNSLRGLIGARIM